MISVVVVDDHPAVQAGLVGLLQFEPGLVCVASASRAADGLAAARRTKPAVVLADYGLPDSDGLTLCCDMKALPAPPGVIVYTAFAKPELLPAAGVAGADAVLDKAAPTHELFETIRTVARGNAQLLSAPPEVLERCCARLNPADIALFGLAVNRTPPNEIAALTGAELDETRRQLRVLVGRLQERPVGPATRSQRA